jgi:hypothetical protein
MTIIDLIDMLDGEVTLVLDGRPITVKDLQLDINDMRIIIDIKRKCSGGQVKETLESLGYCFEVGV